MKKGVITVYLSLVFLLLMSFFLALLEYARVYVTQTMTLRYADMAAEMVSSAYVEPLADRYDLLAVDGGTDGEYLSEYASFLELNLKEDTQGRLFGLYGTVSSLSISDMITFKDDDWASLLDQISSYESYSLGESAVSTLKALVTQLQDTEVDEVVDKYADELSSDGNNMDKAVAQASASADDTDDTEASVGSTVTDPRGGISSWLKSGLLSLVMGDKSVSGKTVDVSDCSWQASKNSSQSIITSFESYSTVSSLLDNQTITDKISDGIKEQGTELLVNLYIFDKFSTLTTDVSDEYESVLKYEVEYILFGKSTDKANLESAITDIFMLRTMLNLVYLYSSSSKGAALGSLAQSLTVFSALPIVGVVLQMLLMTCWASAEAVVVCAALTDGKKVPIMKSDSTWNLTLDQLSSIAKNGGSASSYVRDGSSGLSYDKYLLILLLFTSSEKKLVRMTQLMECNIRLIDGYDLFSLANCLTAANFSGNVSIASKYTAAGAWEQAFNVSFSY